MKASGVLLTSAVLLGVVTGRPYEIKREVLTEVTFTTVTMANVIVYVDEKGIPYQTTTVDEVTTTKSTELGSVAGTVPAASATIQSSPQASTEPGPIEKPDDSPPFHNPEIFAATATTPSSSAQTSAGPSSSDVSPEPSTQVESPHPESEPSQQEPPSALPLTSNSDDGLPLGVTYDPFKPGGCKTEQEVSDEWSKMKDFGIVRIYGKGCDIIPRALQLATKYNQKVMAGIYKTNDQSSESIDDVVQVLADAVQAHANGDWDIVSLVSVENEKINDRTMTASDAVDYIRQAKDALAAVGYHGPVGAVETAPAVIDNPEVCKHSDLTMVNIHAFFDENTKAEDAGEFVRREVERVKKACGDKRVIVTESGWPHDGQAHGKAVASKESQAAALASLRKQFNRDLFIHNAFDCEWKDDSPATFSAERYWGFL